MIFKWNFLVFLQVFVFSFSENIDSYDSEEFHNPDGKYEYDEILVEPKNSSRAGGETFSYLPTSPYGPSRWTDTWPTCGGFQQTPINIETSMARKSSNPTIRMNYFKKPVSSIRIVNNKYTIVLIPTFADFKLPIMHCCGNSRRYILDSIHLHWGPDCGGGSEHTVDGHRYAAEMHMVHFNRKYQTLANALSYPDGLAVVGIFLELAEESNNDGTSNNKFIKYLNNVKDGGETTITGSETFTIQELIKREVDDYFMYQGSLTVPPCNEVVQWIVAVKPIKIYPSELAVLRSMKGVDGDMLYNFRPLLPLNGRTIRCC